MATVLNAMREFIDVVAATTANYQPFLGCTTGPDERAMGPHYVNGVPVGDGEIDATRSKALIYEPSEERMRPVDVEFIVDYLDGKSARRECSKVSNWWAVRTAMEHPFLRTSHWACGDTCTPLLCTGTTG